MGMSMMGMAPPHPMMMQQGPPGAPMPPAFGHAYPPQPPAGMYSVCNGLRRCDAEHVLVDISRLWLSTTYVIILRVSRTLARLRFSGENLLLPVV